MKAPQNAVAAEPLLTTAEVSVRLRKKPAAVRAMARRGQIAFYRVGKSQLFAPSDVEAFLSRNRVEARRTI